LTRLWRKIRRRPFERLVFAGQTLRGTLSGPLSAPLPRIQPVNRGLGLFAPAVPGRLGALAGAGIGARAEALGLGADMVGPGHGEERIGRAGPGRGPVGHGGEARGLLAGKHGQQLVEPRGPGGGKRIALGRAVEPGEMGEQEAAVVAAAAGDLLAMVEHRLLHALERALGQHGLGMGAGEDEGRIPPGGEARAAAAADIGRLRRQGDPRTGRADRAGHGEVMEEAGLALGGEAVVAGFDLVRGGGRGFTPFGFAEGELTLRARHRGAGRGGGGRKILPTRGEGDRRNGGGGGSPPQRGARRKAPSVSGQAAATSPRVGRIAVIRQAERAIGGNPAAAKGAGGGVVG